MFKVLGFDNLFLFELNNQNLYVSVLIILKIFIESKYKMFLHEWIDIIFLKIMIYYSYFSELK